MRPALFAILLFFGAALATSPAPATACAPPCGPIPVDVQINVAKSKGLTFGDQDVLEFEATVVYYVDIDRDGFWYDPQNRPILSFRAIKQPPWVKTTFAPTEFTIPIDDPTFVSNENGAPNELQYRWESPLKITITKVRDPDPATELTPQSKWVNKRDGTFRVTVTGSSTASVLAPGTLNNMGLQEGYGVREFKFIPEVDGVRWVKDEKGVLGPAGGAPPASPASAAEAPAPWVGTVGLMLVALAILLRRRT